MQKPGSAFLLILSLFALPLAAQTIRGTVKLHADGTPLPGVTVTASPPGTSAVTGADGRYELSVPSAAGEVKLTATLAGFQTKSATLIFAVATPLTISSFAFHSGRRSPSDRAQSERKRRRPFPSM